MLNSSSAACMILDIRVLTDEDAEAFWNLWLEALDNEPHSPEQHRSVTFSATAERLRAAEHGGFVLGAFSGRDLIGTATCDRDNKSPKNRHKAFVSGVYVTPSHRRRRIGRALMGILLDRLRSYPDPGVTHVNIATMHAATETFYRTLGFEVWGCEPGALRIAGHYYDACYMKLVLSK